MQIKYKKSNIKYSTILSIAFCIILVVSCGGKKPTPMPPSLTTKPESVITPTETTTATQKYESIPKPKQVREEKYMVISVKIGDKSIGKIKIELYPNEAPKTVANIRKLVNEGFYNGLTFHRVIAGFMIQGGDPKGDGTGGPGYTTPAEFSPKLTHIRGACAMARLDDQVNPEKASSGSQFYICHAPAHFLDGNYTIFGQVVEGMDVVDAIAKVPTSKPGDKPLTPVVMTKVILE